MNYFMGRSLYTADLALTDEDLGPPRTGVDKWADALLNWTTSRKVLASNEECTTYWFERVVLWSMAASRLWRASRDTTDRKVTARAVAAYSTHTMPLKYCNFVVMIVLM